MLSLITNALFLAVMFSSYFLFTTISVIFMVIIRTILKLNKKAQYKFTIFIKHQWLKLTATLLSFYFPNEIFIAVDKNILKTQERKFIALSNHYTNFDWIFLLLVFSKLGLYEDLVIILKDSLQNVPIFGYGMKTFGYIFLSRNWSRDHAVLDKGLSNLRNRNSFTLLFFPEGTILYNESYKKSVKFCIDNKIRILSTQEIEDLQSGTSLNLSRSLSSVHMEVYDKCAILKENFDHNNLLESKVSDKFEKYKFDESSTNQDHDLNKSPLNRRKRVDVESSLDFTRSSITGHKEPMSYDLSVKYNSLSDSEKSTVSIECDQNTSFSEETISRRRKNAKTGNSGKYRNESEPEKYTASKKNKNVTSKLLFSKDTIQKRYLEGESSGHKKHEGGILSSNNKNVSSTDEFTNYIHQNENYVPKNVLLPRVKGYTKIKECLLEESNGVFDITLLPHAYKKFPHEEYTFRRIFLERTKPCLNFHFLLNLTNDDNKNKHWIYQLYKDKDLFLSRYFAEVSHRRNNDESFKNFKEIIEGLSSFTHKYEFMSIRMWSDESIRYLSMMIATNAFFTITLFAILYYFLNK